MPSIESDLLAGLTEAFIDSTQTSSPALRAEFVSNRPDQAKAVSQTIERELRYCDRYDMSVAFITAGGIAPLKMALRERDAHGVSGRLLTTDYELFTEPAALESLMQLEHLEIRLFRVNDDPREGFHTKGYLFHDDKRDVLRVLIGSANMTHKALSINREWNALLVSSSQGKFAQELQAEFEELWRDPRSVVLTPETLSQYRAEVEQRAAAQADFQRELQRIKAKQPANQLIPNAMQQAFVDRLKEFQVQREHRALLISATGTGKTYASAFGVQALNPKRVLFLVHREQIAKAAMKSYRRVLGEAYSYGLLSGTHKGKDADCVFATIQTVSREETLTSFDPTAFDVIVIDEVHRAGAESYARVMNYFHPTFWLGMTASPERTDGFDIFSLFDHNIAHEIRLQEALEEDLLCPFHYYGISDEIEEKDGFRWLAAPARVKHIQEQANYYRYSGDRVKGLIFCSDRKEARELSVAFNERGWRTLALSGDDSQAVREAAIERLVQKENDETALDYLLTVDIFNEGIDIPEVNQVIFLRETQSPIVFVQQLGRGLRKSPGKDFVVVLDFIASYDNNYLIPVALSGDRSYNKERMRETIASGGANIPGLSSIHFSEIAKERIFKAIDQAKTNRWELLQASYQNLRFKLGRRPTLLDFEDYQEIDPVKFFEQTSSSAKIRTYYEALKCFQEEDFVADWSDMEEGLYRLISHQVGAGKRLTEWAVVKAAMAGSEDALNDARRELETIYQLLATPEIPARRVSDAELRSAARVLTGTFARNKLEREGLLPYALLSHGSVKTDAPIPGDFTVSDWMISAPFKAALEKPSFKMLVDELLDFIYHRWENEYQRVVDGTGFVLGKTYSYVDVCRLFNWDSNLPGTNIGGYFYDKKTDTFPIFVNYSKDASAINYEDRFIDERTMVTISKTNRKIDSPDARRMQKLDDFRNTRIYLFVRKTNADKEGKAFTFLGEVEALDGPRPHQVDGHEAGKAFEMTWKLAHPVAPTFYSYLTDGVRTK